VYGAEEVTTGASNDLQQVRNIARRMVAQWGFSTDQLAPTAWEPAENPGMFAGSTAASEETESTIDDEVAKLVDEAYSTCKQALADNRSLLDATVDALLEKETIDGPELDALVEKYTGKPVLNKRPEMIAVVPEKIAASTMMAPPMPTLMPAASFFAPMPPSNQAVVPVSAKKKATASSGGFGAASPSTPKKEKPKKEDEPGLARPWDAPEDGDDTGTRAQKRGGKGKLGKQGMGPGANPSGGMSAGVKLK
jgi:hypothetical protein